MTKGSLRRMQVAVFSILSGCAFEASPEPSFFDTDGGGSSPVVRPATRGLVEQQSAVQLGSSSESDAQEPPPASDGAVELDDSAVPKDADVVTVDSATDDAAVEPDAAVDAGEDAASQGSVQVCESCERDPGGCAEGLVCAKPNNSLETPRCWPLARSTSCAALCPGLPDAVLVGVGAIEIVTVCYDLDTAVFELPAACDRGLDVCAP